MPPAAKRLVRRVAHSECPNTCERGRWAPPVLIVDISLLWMATADYEIQLVRKKPVALVEMHEESNRRRRPRKILPVHVSSYFSKWSFSGKAAQAISVPSRIIVTVEPWMDLRDFIDVHVRAMYAGKLCGSSRAGGFERSL